MLIKKLDKKRGK